MRFPALPVSRALSSSLRAQAAPFTPSAGRHAALIMLAVGPQPQPAAAAAAPTRGPHLVPVSAALAERMPPAPAPAPQEPEQAPELPTYSFREYAPDAAVSYYTDAAEADALLAALAIRGPCGFDVEWRPNFLKGTTPPRLASRLP
jgi:hypothetical protein